MKKYWKIQGLEGLWTLYRELDDYVWLRAEGEGNFLTLRSHIRPASFKEIHGRAFPPRIWGGNRRNDYEEEHPKVVTVYYSRFMKRWQVLTEWEELQFPTHAEAIAYAQKQAKGEL